MHAAIVATLFLASVTAALASYDRAGKRQWIGTAISGAMALWFAFAAVWMMRN